MADAEGIDLYADVDDFGQASSQDHQDNVVDSTEPDLYDAMVTAAADSTEETKNDPFVSKQELVKERRCPLYVGNLTWWTSDQDLSDLIANSGVTDLIEIKFHENRTNGQSKGFATVIVGSQNSSDMLMTKLPKKEINGKPILVTHCTKQNLKMFDIVVPSKPQVTNGGDQNEHHSGSNVGRASSPASASSQTRQNQHSYQPPNYVQYSSELMPQSGMPPPASQGSSLSQGPQTMVLLPPSGPASSGVHLVQPPIIMTPGGPAMVMRGGPPPPGMIGHPPQRPEWNMHPGHGYPPHPASGMTHGYMSGGRPSGYPPHHPNLVQYPSRFSGSSVRASGHYGRSSSTSYSGSYQRRETAMPKISESEFEEVLKRNSSISSGAITRAVQDAAAGDFPSAIETLVTAVSLIRQSKIADSDPCKTLISSLQDTLQGLEQKSYETKVSHYPRSRSRDRSGSCESDEQVGSRYRSRSPIKAESRHRSQSTGSDQEYREKCQDRDRRSRSRGDRNKSMEKRNNRL